MDQKDNIIVRPNIFRFLFIHIFIGISISLLYGLITQSYIELVIIMCAVLISAVVGFFLIDANEKRIVLNTDMIEGPAHSSIFSTKRLSIPLYEADLSSSKNIRLWKGHSYIASENGKKIILDKKFLSDEQVGHVFNIIQRKLTRRLQSDAQKTARR